MSEGLRAIIAGRKSTKVKSKSGEGISLDSQDERARDFAARNGMTVVASTRDVISGVTMPMRRKDLGQWLTDPELMARYDAVIAFATDRFSRGPDTDWSAIETWAAENGKTLIMVDNGDGVRYPSRGDSDYWQWVAAKRKSRTEWESIQERNIRSQASIKANGGVVGRAPWGMKIVGELYSKTLVPTVEGRTWIPLIFQAVIDGKSLREIAKWLDESGVSTMSGKPWNEFYIGNRIIKNPTYYGKRPNAGPKLEIEPLVSVTMWKQANASLKARFKPGRSTVKVSKVLLTPICAVCYGVKRDGCESGKSPMYRVWVGKDANRKAYYRCSGHGPQRKGCGAPMIPCDALDTAAVAFMLQNTSKHVTQEWISGDDTADDIARLEESLNLAKSRQESNAIWDQIEALQAKPSVAPHWAPTETDQTEGQYFASLDNEGMRKHLATFEILANYKATDPRLPSSKTPGFIIMGLPNSEAYGFKPL